MKKRKGAELSIAEDWSSKLYKDSSGSIKFKGGIFSMSKINNRLFVFTPNKLYEIVKTKRGFKKRRVRI